MNDLSMVGAEEASMFCSEYENKVGLVHNRDKEKESVVTDFRNRSTARQERDRHDIRENG